MEVAGRRFSVVGMGRSGLAAARVLAQLGGDVIVSDKRDDAELREKAKSLDKCVKVILGREFIRPGDVVVLSPGISPSTPVFREAYRVGSEVMGELELFYRLWPGRIIAITGTDGKSTVTSLVAHILNEAGLRAHAAGNIGIALTELLAFGRLREDDIVVAEVSCFQLVTTTRFRPMVAVVTNLAEDHLDWHGSFSAYVRAKARILANQAAGDWFVRNLDDPILRTWLDEKHHEVKNNGQCVLEVSRKEKVAYGAWYSGTHFMLAKSEVSKPVIARPEFLLVGPHNEENALLSMAATIPFDVPEERLATALKTFKGLPHRIEFVRMINDVKFYNDSKATNPHATAAAIMAFGEPLVLIAGGYEKGLSFEPLAFCLKDRCVGLVLCGANAERMFAELGTIVATEIVKELGEAVASAFEMAVKNRAKVVLFSPASSSFDRYVSFEERGEHFRYLVENLEHLKSNNTL